MEVAGITVGVISTLWFASGSGVVAFLFTVVWCYKNDSVCVYQENRLVGEEVGHD
jgi:hypothetical protein